MQSNKTMCDNFSKEIWLYMDNALSVEKMAVWKAHLQVCSDCRRTYEEIRQTLNAYNRADMDDIDDLKFERILQRLTKKRTQFPYPKTAAVLAMAASVLIALWFGLNRPHKAEFAWNTTALDQRITEMDSSINALESDEWLTSDYTMDAGYIDDAIQDLQNDLTKLQNDFSTF